MPEPDLLTLFVAPLERLGLDYIITGSVAAMLYGEPRLTNDVDLVVDLKPGDAVRLREVFSQPDFYCPPLQEILVEAARSIRGHINVIHVPSAMKADFYLAGDDWLHRWALPRRHRIDLGGRTISLAPPEYVIVRKLSFFREGGSSKHLRDVRAILAARRDRLALEDIATLSSREGVRDVWEALLAEAGGSP
jgi:hypothetical protein